MAKRKKSIVGWLVAAVAVLGVGVLGFATGGFLDWDKESMKDRFVPKTELAVKKVEIVNSPDITITADETKANLYHVGGAILYQEEAIEGLTGHLYEVKIRLKDVNRKTAALKVSKGLDETVKTADLKWLAEDNSYTLLDVAEVGVDTVLTFDNDGDYETLDDEFVLTFKIDPLVKSQAVLLDINHDLTLPESPVFRGSSMGHSFAIRILQNDETIIPNVNYVLYFSDLEFFDTALKTKYIYIDGVLINYEDSQIIEEDEYYYGFDYEEQFVNLKVIEIRPLVDFVGLNKLTADY